MALELHLSTPWMTFNAHVGIHLTDKMDTSKELCCICS